MNQFLTSILLLVIFAFAAGKTAQADSLGDFFQRLGNSIKNASHHPTPPPRRAPQKHNNRQQKDSNTLQNENTQTIPNSSAQAVTPTPPPVRAATSPEVRNQKRDIPYAVPAPNKPGFVTSPFAPNAGLVDVRGFPSGTEVKDPYTNKMFLTP